VTRPRVDLLAAPAQAHRMVLVAHGGQEHSYDDPHDWRTALLRMWPLAAAARSAAPDAAVGLVRYRYRGWNDEQAHAAADLLTLLDEVPDTVTEITLVGHSMGGRAVLRAGGHDRVTGVLALAPWLPESDPLVELPDRVVVLAHGDQDRLTSPALTARYAGRLRSAGHRVAHLTGAGETHGLLRRPGDWDELVRRFVGRTLDPGWFSDDPARPADPLPRWSSARGAARAVASIAAARLRLRVLPVSPPA
jgi:predicted esterase